MVINIVGNYGNGYVGETSDLNHIVREMEILGHTVQRVPQDIWKAFCEGVEPGGDWVLPLKKADINIICKWHHFIGDYITALKMFTSAPVFYWVWDYMWDQGLPEWHIEMAKAADLYLGNDVRSPWYKDLPIQSYYFPFDVADSEIEISSVEKKVYEVTFFGSWIGQGNRQEWLKEINKTNPIKVFSWNHNDWPEEFTDVSPAVYGKEFNKEVAKSKIVLGFSVNPNTWGYWSNRVGKVLLAGGFLLYQYAPGMELFLRDGAEYFSSIEEAQEKIDHYLIAEDERYRISKRGEIIARDNFSSAARVKQLMILIDRFIQTGGVNWQL